MEKGWPGWLPLGQPYLAQKGRVGRALILVRADPSGEVTTF